MAKTAKKGYVGHISSKETPQTEKARETQVKGRAGGYVFKVDDWTRLQRFLILGNEGGSYYASERELTFENYDCVKRCLALDHKKTIDTIVEVSDEGRAMNNAPAIFALAVCSVSGSEEAKAYANQEMPKVARFSTDLYQWVHDVLALKNGKKGKGLLRAIGRWYTGKDVVALAYQICKYPQRALKDGSKWSHADLLRLARISRGKSGNTARNGSALTLPSDEHGKLFQYAIHGITSKSEVSARAAEKKKTGKDQEAAGLSPTQLARWKTNDDFKYIWAHEQAKKATKTSEVVALIEEFGLTRESIPPQFRNEIEVQKALLPRMPMTALIRNLGQMTSTGLLKPLGKETKLVVEKLTNEEAIQKSRIHPMTILMAQKVYDSGRGVRTSWNRVSAISDAMEKAFYKAFKYVEPTGKNYLLGVDVSGSMGWNCAGGKVSAAQAAAVVAMTIARTEQNYDIMGFAHTFKDLGIKASDSLSDVMMKTNSHNFGRTDCSLPMQYALKKDLDVDVFVVLTDNETYYGSMHPFEALKKYREKCNPEAKLAVLAFEASEFSIADPSDAGMIDIAGLDSNVPKLLAEFAKGNV